MSGLFGLLKLGTRSLQVQGTGVEVAGQNLANVNNPAYARQRIAIQSSPSIDRPHGPQGTGAEIVGIEQIRNALVDRQINSEISVGSSLEAHRGVLKYAQASLGEFLDLNGDTGSKSGLSVDLGGLFEAFRSISNSPGSLTERQILISKAEDLANHFNQINARLSSLNSSLNKSLELDVDGANSLLGGIAALNNQISNLEKSTGGSANELRDLRQEKLEELSRLVKYEVADSPSNGLTISVNGSSLVGGNRLLDTLQTYDGGGEQFLVRTATGGTPLKLTGGHMHGTIDARDGVLKSVRDQINTLASTLVSEINEVHGSGFAPKGGTGLTFFEGTDAATIRVNAGLVGDPSRLQLSGINGNTGDNQIALSLAQLGDKQISNLGDLSIRQSYSGVVAQIDQALASVIGKAADQHVVEKMLFQQRDAVSGVSIDEEMSDLMRYQKAFQASAKLISTVEEMIDTVINMKR